jgi:hypothetical protein
MGGDMNERVHGYLDGEIPYEELTAQERLEAEEHLRVLEEVVPSVRRSTLEVTASVMSRIAWGTADAHDSEGPSRTREGSGGAAPGGSVGPEAGGSAGPVEWLWTPRTVRVRPAWGLLAAAALLLVVVLPGRGGEGDPGRDLLRPTGEAALAPGPVAGPTIFVQFRLEAPGASEVRLAGSFTGWEPRYALHRTGDGAWTVLVPLSAGIHDYAFVVDGDEWVTDPSAPRVDDGFGGENSRLALLLANGERES